MGGMACGSTIVTKCSTVGRSNNSSSFLLTLHSCNTVTPRLADDVSLFSSFSRISIQHTCSPQTLFYNNSLHRDPQRPPSFTRMWTESNQSNNKLRQCSLHNFSILFPLLLTSSQLHTHSLQGIFLGAWPIRFPDQSIKPIKKDPITSKFNHFLDQFLT